MPCDVVSFHVIRTSKQTKVSSVWNSKRKISLIILSGHCMVKLLHQVFYLIFDEIWCICFSHKHPSSLCEMWTWWKISIKLFILKRCDKPQKTEFIVVNRKRKEKSATGYMSCLRIFQQLFVGNIYNRSCHHCRGCF